MPYQAPLADTRFQLEHIVGFDRLAASFPEADLDTVLAMCEAAGKIAEDVFEPLRVPMDLAPVKLDGDQVITPDGVGDALSVLAESGPIGVVSDEAHGGLAMPLVVQIACNEYLSGANLALQLCGLLTQGQIEALEAHASDAIKSEVIPKLNSGEWSGTMLLTEPQAGTDVGALKTKAERANDDSYLLSGQKIFITWGEHNHSQNISHLTLARLPDAPAGPKGISLFYVPKFLPDGERNAIKCIGLEHKMGIHGSPTCVMELSGAKGWLVGEENNGLAAMFTMMNNARLNVGVQGYGVAEAAYQHAVNFAKERVQGRTKGTTGAIIDHADVRRMLISMKTKIHIARALGLDCAISLDLGKTDPQMAARGGVLTPLAKSYGTDIGMEVTSEAVQVFGGMGFIEETGAAQFMRDVRITPIYEGTNGVQAMDLVGRKMGDDGATILAMLDEISLDYEGAKEAAIAATKALVSREVLLERGADAVDYQRALASVFGAAYLQKGAARSADYQIMFDDFASRELPAQVAKLNAIAKSAREVNRPNVDFF